MSFILSTPTETFCDWRFSLPPTCSSYSFFYGVQAFAIASCTLQVILEFICLCLKRFALGDPWRAFTTGAPGAQLVLFWVIAIWMIQGFVVLLGNNPLAGQIMWAIVIPLPLFPMVFFLSTLVESFPTIFMGNYQAPIKKLIKSVTLSKTIFWIFTLFLFLLNIVLHVASSQLKISGNHVVADQIAQAAVIILAVNVTVVLVMFIYVSRTFIHVIEKCKEDMELVNTQPSEETKERTELMILVTKKIRSNIIASVLDAGLLVIYHVLLAAYPEFFSNIPFSKAMSVIFVGFFVAASIPLMFMHLYIDIKRVLHRQSTRGSKSRSHQKDPLVLALTDLQKDPSLPAEPL